MRYKLTLLKDLPNFPKGTVFKYSVGKKMLLSSFRKQQFLGLYDSDRLTWPPIIPENIINDPEWIKKEVDYDSLIDLKCNVCGETRGEISVNTTKCSYGGHSVEVYFEYACKHGVRRLK